VNDLKEKRILTNDVLDKFKTRIKALTNTCEQDLAKKYNMTPEFLQAWIIYYKQDPKVKEFLNDKDDL
jgi:hypothetical protein